MDSSGASAAGVAAFFSATSGGFAPGAREPLTAVAAEELESADGTSNNFGQVNQVQLIVHDQEWDADSDGSTENGTLSHGYRFGRRGPMIPRSALQAARGADADAAAGSNPGTAAAAAFSSRMGAAAPAACPPPPPGAVAGAGGMVPFYIEEPKDTDRFGRSGSGTYGFQEHKERRAWMRSPRNSADLRDIAGAQKSPAAASRPSAPSASSSPHQVVQTRMCGRFVHFAFFSCLHITDFALRICSMCVVAHRWPPMLWILIPTQVMGTLMAAYITFHDADVSLWIHKTAFRCSASFRCAACGPLVKACACALSFCVLGCLQLIQVKRAWARQLHAAHLLEEVDIEDRRTADASSVPAFGFACGERIVPVAVLTGVPYLFVIMFSLTFLNMSSGEGFADFATLAATSLVVLSTVSLGIREIDFAVSSYVVKCAHARFVDREHGWVSCQTWFFTFCHVLFRATEVSLRVLLVGTFFLCTYGGFEGQDIICRILTCGALLLDYCVCVALLRCHSPRKERLSAHLFVAVMLLVSDLAHFVDQPSFTAPARRLSRCLRIWRLFVTVIVVCFFLAQLFEKLPGRATYPEGWCFQTCALATTLLLYYLCVLRVGCIRERGEDLHTAAQKGNAQRIAKLLEPSDDGTVLDVNACSKDALQLTPAMLAAEGGHEHVLKLLHEAGAELNSRSADGDTCLHFAVRGSQVQTLKYLIAHGADGHIANSMGHFPWDVEPTRGHKTWQSRQVRELYPQMKRNRHGGPSSINSRFCDYSVNAQPIGGLRLAELFRDAAKDDTPAPHALLSVSGLIVARAAGVLALRILRQAEEADGLIPFGRLQRVDEIGRELGRGGFARVIKVELPLAHRGTRQFALKLQRKRNPRTAASEAMALRKAGHPFIVRLEQAFQTRFYFAFLLELCPTDLNRVLCETVSVRDGEEEPVALGLPPERAARYMGQVLLALTYLHDFSLTYVHRDVKPENVLISRTDEAKLADFGLAKDLGDADPLHIYGFAGTPGFAAPELTQRENGHGADRGMMRDIHRDGQATRRGVHAEVVRQDGCKQDAYAFGVTLQLTLLGRDAGRVVDARGKRVLRPLDHTEEEMAELLTNLVLADRLSQDARDLLVEELLPWDPRRRSALSSSVVLSHPFFLQTLECMDLKECLMPSTVGPSPRQNRSFKTPRSFPPRESEPMRSSL